METEIYDVTGLAETVKNDTADDKGLRMEYRMIVIMARVAQMHLQYVHQENAHFEAQVNKLLSEGWQLHGATQFFPYFRESSLDGDVVCCQAFTRPKVPSE